MGDTWVACKHGAEATFNCQLQGLSCFDDGKGHVGCAAGGDCDPHTFVETCVGQTLVYCDFGRAALVDCSASGRTCVPKTFAGDMMVAHGGYCSM
jgi:hypothetical protein